MKKEEYRKMLTVNGERSGKKRVQGKQIEPTAVYTVREKYAKLGWY